MRLAEAKKVSLSLFTLRLVLSALAFNKSHIPFRDSKLTRILQNSLGGNSFTVFIVNISPSEYFYQETLDSLIYGDITGKIKNKPKINQDLTSKIIADLKKEIEDLRKYNDDLKKYNEEEKKNFLEQIIAREREINLLKELAEKTPPKLDQNDQEYLKIRKQELINLVKNEAEFGELVSGELERLEEKLDEFKNEDETINMLRLLKKLEDQEHRIYDLIEQMQKQKENYENEILENQHNYESEILILMNLNINDYNLVLTDVQRDILNSTNSNELKQKLKNDKSLIKPIYELLKYQERIIQKNVSLNQTSVIIDAMNAEVQTDCPLLENEINTVLLNSISMLTEKSSEDIQKYQSFVGKSLSKYKISSQQSSSVCTIL
jgi:hypothetical protein